MDLTRQYDKNGQFMQSQAQLLNITSNQMLAGEAPYPSQQLANAGLLSIRRAHPANQTVPSMMQIREDVRGLPGANSNYLEYTEIGATSGDYEPLPDINKALNDMNYKDLVLNMNQVPPGGRGGPGPGHLHEATKEEAAQPKAPLETAEFNLTPFVNQSPAEKRLKFETARGRQLGITKGPPKPLPQIAQVMGPGTASGVHSDRVALGRRQ